MPRTTGHMAAELHALLSSAGLTGPFVLVGHSLGGFVIRLYASRYPHDVAGLVLVDSSHEEQTRRLPPELFAEREKRIRTLRFARLLARMGLVRLAGALGVLGRLTAFEKLPAGERPAARALFYRSSFLDTAYGELVWLQASSDQVQAACGSLGDLPLAVLSATVGNPALRQHDARETWIELQRELAGLSTNSRHVVAEASGHYIQQDEPELVSDGIRWVVEQARRR